jgi:hypothetical protein
MATSPVYSCLHFAIPRTPPTGFFAGGISMHFLHYGRLRKPLASVKPDDRYPTMWRIHWPDGSVSDMVNLARAKDAAMAIAERGPPRLERRIFRWQQKCRESARGGGHSDFGGVPATPVAISPKNDPAVSSASIYADGYWGV